MLKQVTILLTSVLLLAGVALVAPTDEMGAYQLVANWPSMPEGSKLGEVGAVATDTADNVYILHRGKQPIMVFDKDGKFLRGWGDGLFKKGHGLCVDGDGSVWTTDIGTHQVTKFNPEGKVLLTLGKKGEPGDGRDQFNQPTDVAVAPTGEVYVSDGYGNSRVVKFAKDGKYLKDWGKKGIGEGEFHQPHAVCLDARGRVFIGDLKNNRIQMFDAEGKFLAQWKEIGAPHGLFLTGDGRMLVADGKANVVKVRDDQGKVVGRWGAKGTSPGQFNYAHWVCMDSKGAVYVAEFNGSRVQKFVVK